MSGEQPTWLPSPRHFYDGPQGFSVYAFSFHPESRHIVTAFGSPSVPMKDPCVARIWDLANGAILAVLTGHSLTVTGVSFSQDGKSVLSASLDGSARIWDAGSAVEAASLHVHEKYLTTPAAVAKACFSPNGKFVATIAASSSTVQLWRTDSASCIAEFIGHRGADVSQVMFSLNGEFLASGDVDGVVVIHPFPSSLRD